MESDSFFIDREGLGELQYCYDVVHILRYIMCTHLLQGTVDGPVGHTPLRDKHEDVRHPSLSLNMLQLRSPNQA